MNKRQLSILEALGALQIKAAERGLVIWICPQFSEKDGELFVMATLWDREGKQHIEHFLSTTEEQNLNTLDRLARTIREEARK